MNTGERISHYTILEKLGGGGMGVVYKAEDTRLKRTVALKFLPSGLTRDPEAMERFTREAQAASALQHDNICTIHDIDEGPGGELFIVMDFYDGESLKKKIERGPLPISEAIEIASQICRGLAKAHAAGMVHRDVKPANVMMTSEGEAKIVDFGLAKLAGQTRLTKTGATTGTVLYMSPEQANGETVDRRTDVWSLGATLYEMITGRPPFRGEYENSVMYSIVNEVQQPLTALRSDVPLDLEKIVDKALAKDPRERYQHADDFLVDLRRMQGEITAGTVSSASTPRRSRKRIARRTMFLSAAFLALAAIVLFFVIPSWQDQVLASNPIPVAVITFENQTGDSAYDYLREAIPNLLITNLEQSRYLRVAPWERLRDLMRQMGKDRESVITSELGIELCRRGDITVIVVGRFTKAGEVFATDVKVMDVETKEILKSANAKGRGVESILENQIDDLSKQIAAGAGLTERRVVATPLKVTSVTTSSMDAYHHFLRGKGDYHRFYYEEARTSLEEAIQLDSTFVSAHAYLAFTLAAMNEREGARRELTLAMRYAQHSPERERLYIESAYSWYVQGNLDKGILIMQEAVQRYPDVKDGYRWLGMMHRFAGSYELAVGLLERALLLDPEYADALNELGYVYARLGKYEKAIECFRRQIAARPSDANPLDSMAELLFRMGKLEEAIAGYRRVLDVKPDFHSSHLPLGYLLALRGRTDQAIAEVGTFIASVPSPGWKVEGYSARAFFRLQSGRLRGALADIDSAEHFADVAGDTVWKARTGFIRGWIHLALGDYGQCRRAFKEYYESVLKGASTDRTRTLVQRECSLLMVDLREEAHREAVARLGRIDSLLTTVDEESRREILYHRNRLHAELLLAQDSSAHALEVSNALGSLEMPTMDSWNMLRYNLPWVQDTRARALVAVGDPDEAIREYKRLVEFDSTSWDRRLRWPPYRLELARLYEGQGDREKASQQYELLLRGWKHADTRLPVLEQAQEGLERLGTPLRK